jgi:FkbM family methyltransferase
MIIFNHHKVIDLLAQFLPSNPTIVEAGAFNGADTKKMALKWPQGKVYAFEPVPEIYERLLHNTDKLTNVYCYPYALNNKNNTELFYVSENPKNPGIASQAGSLHKPKKRLQASPLIFPRTITVDTITLPTWAKQNNINHIDLLWLDTQGHELIILQAAQSLLDNINLILAEVSFIESYDNQPALNELIAWMQHQGFDHIASDFESTTKNFFGNVLFAQSLKA